MERLIQLPDQDLSCDQLAQLLPQLPANIKQLPQYKDWEQKLMHILVTSARASSDTDIDLDIDLDLDSDSDNDSDRVKASEESIAYLLLYLFADVHSLLTSPAKLKCFWQLPFATVKAWAASDNLVVDSENSVVVALGSWIEASEDCSAEQQKELSGLIRVKHLTPGVYLA
jgi:hypothetical protein